jgi:hypothetical protein
METAFNALDPEKFKAATEFEHHLKIKKMRRIIFGTAVVFLFLGGFTVYLFYQDKETNS